MKISAQQLHLFATLSGDYNPVHLVDEYAHQTMFGHRIVYGIYQLMLCLEEISKKIEKPFFITSLKADFKKSLPVAQSFEIETAITDSSAKASLISGSKLSNISLSYELVENVGHVSKAVYPFQEPNFHKTEEDLSWHEQIGFDSKLCQKLFPMCNKYVHHVNIGILLASTRIVGMKYPGKNSIFNALRLNFSYDSSESLVCKTLKTESLFGECRIEISAPFVNGEISAFLRPEIAKQNSIEKLLSKNMKADFSKQRALVIGGSRGIGLQCLRLLALGGAKTMFTYYKSEKDADSIIQELKTHNLSAESVRFNINRQSATSLEKIKAFAPTHLYYFATPKISFNAKTFNEKLFQTFCHYYMFALHELINLLKPFGLKNIFTPSSVAITEFPRDMMEYAFAKAAMECWGGGNEPR